AYDNQGRLSTLTVDTAVFTYGYQGVNPRVRSLTRPNGSHTAYDYTGLNQLEHHINKDASSQLLSRFDFQYNDRDLIRRETVTRAPAISGFTAHQISYDYNALNQVTATTPPEKLFTHDPDGNLTAGYTPAGLPFTAQYDAENRLKSIAYTDGGTAHRREFVYGHNDFLGKLLRYENDTLVAEVRFVRDGLLAIQERDAANAVTREYVWGQDKGGGIGGLLTLRQNGQDYDYLYDGKGNVSAVIDSAQAVVASYRYDSFGRLKVKSGALEQPYQFSTKRYLADVGLNYYGYRFYAPGFGRWLNRDPIGEAGGLNLYEFCFNNPVLFIDAYGLDFSDTISTLDAAVTANGTGGLVGTITGGG
ncbi:MAG: RHS repeat-associated core domain-containing protein, partial [Desulfobacterales bacterium]|nr:RHS repeat-associated core domain-containing protein [Desulfobacterales bacterium]